MNGFLSRRGTSYVVEPERLCERLSLCSKKQAPLFVVHPSGLSVDLLIRRIKKIMKHK